MINFIRHLLTGADNSTYDIGRVLWALSTLIGLGITIWSKIKHFDFDLEQYGVGVGALLTAGGAALKLKETTEPKP